MVMWKISLVALFMFRYLPAVVMVAHAHAHAHATRTITFSHQRNDVLPTKNKSVEVEIIWL